MNLLAEHPYVLAMQLASDPQGPLTHPHVPDPLACQLLLDKLLSPAGFILLKFALSCRK